MKLYNSLGPNPRLVRMFMAEKGIDLEKIEIDLMKGENREADYVARNPAGEMPSLELDDGRVLAETVAMCEYLDEKYPDPPLIGADAEARALTRMWTRRVELHITNPMTDAFRSAEGKGLFEKRRHLIPQAADDWKQIAREGLAWLDEQIAGRDYIAGDAFSLADIVAYNLLDFGNSVGQPIPENLSNVNAWFARIGARPSADASLHPVAVAAGMRG